MIFLLLLLALAGLIFWARQPTPTKARYRVRSVLGGLATGPYMILAVFGSADIDALDNWIDAARPSSN